MSHYFKEIRERKKMLKNFITSFSKFSGLSYQTKYFMGINSKVTHTEQPPAGRDLPKKKERTIEFYEKKKKNKIKQKQPDDKKLKRFKHNIYYQPHIMEQ